MCRREAKSARLDCRIQRPAASPAPESSSNITSKSLEVAFTFFRKCRVQTLLLARGSILRTWICGLAPRLEQAREARERSQRDHIKVDQVELREWERSEPLSGGFYA